MNNAQRLSATPKALDLIRELSEEFGDLMFYQAGGCCEGTKPQCFRKGHYYPRTKDVCIGTVLGFYFWVDHDLYEYWKYNHFELDVSDGFGAGGFSLETAKKKTFKSNEIGSLSCLSKKYINKTNVIAGATAKITNLKSIIPPSF